MKIVFSCACSRRIGTAPRQHGLVVDGGRIELGRAWFRHVYELPDALDARSGAVRWRSIVGGQVASGPTTYKADNRQFIAVVAGHSLFTFGLRD